MCVAWPTAQATKEPLTLSVSNDCAALAQAAARADGGYRTRLTLAKDVLMETPEKAKHIHGRAETVTVLQLPTAIATGADVPTTLLPERSLQAISSSVTPR
jgi:hypothetical protein